MTFGEGLLLVCIGFFLYQSGECAPGEVRTWVKEWVLSLLVLSALGVAVLLALWAVWFIAH
jgi:hypothetical protein